MGVGPSCMIIYEQCFVKTCSLSDKSMYDTFHSHVMLFDSGIFSTVVHAKVSMAHQPRDCGLTFSRTLTSFFNSFHSQQFLISKLLFFKMAPGPVMPPSTTSEPLRDFTISQLTTSEDVLTHLPQLCQILQDCVNEGSSIGFLAPLSTKDAEIYWKQVAELIAKGTLHLFILVSGSSLTNGTLSSDHTPSSQPIHSTAIPSIVLGTIQLVTIPKTTHLHRAEVIKLLVSPSARRLGIARRLMSHVENFARGTGRTMLTLDTATESPALEMYRRLDWEEWGTCKDYASWPDGSRCDATFFRKDL